MSASTDLELMRASMLLETDPAAAARQAGALLMVHPGHDAASLLLAEACRRLGNASSAVDIIEALARAQPTSALVQLELGRTYVACARSGEALAALQRAVALDPNLADAWLELSAQQLLSGETASADAAYAQYRRLAGDPPDLADAYLAFDQRRLDAAEQAVQGRLRAGTNEVAAFTLLAAIASRRGDDLAVEAALNQVLTRAPCDGTAREQLAHLMIRQGRGDEALLLTQRLLAAEPGRSAYGVLKVQALQLSERHAEGVGVMTQLIAEHPDDADLWLLAGHQQRYRGHAQQAIESYRRAIALRPGHGMAYWALANFETFHFAAHDIETMESRLALASPGGPDATALEFSLGRAREERSEFAASFEHYARGNSLARAAFYYDPNATTAFVQRFKAIFTERFFAERADWGHGASDPIFIVGLPRSGSTLLEQILASHSAVEGTRELEYVPTLARELAGPPQTASRYPENLTALQKPALEALAARYLASALKHRPLGKPRFVDKMHGNFASLGLIHLMFPHAAIIDCRRHPLACGFACYKQLFNPGMNFAYDLNDLGLYYRDYADLMAHADRVLPGRVYRLYYERLVTDTENEVRRLLNYCQLPFEQGCLRFYENRRVAQTISLEQVQRPIYTAGLEQWCHYERWLDPLKAALQNLPQAYPRF
ncbi:MAG TPA: sulfotransferase [Steroidobacteraceae bacterium]